MTDAREKLKKANDEVHKAFNDVLAMPDVDVEKKSRAAGHMAIIFEQFTMVHKHLRDD